MIDLTVMHHNNSAFKGWENCVESFISNGVANKMQSFHPQFTPDMEGKVDISWSSSSEDESIHGKCKKKRVVTRLNFDECINRPSGQVTPTYSRSLDSSNSVDKNKSFECLVPPENSECLTTPTKSSTLLPADINLPSSPVIMRRKRRRSLNSVLVSPVLKRRSFSKIRKLSPEINDSPSSVISKNDNIGSIDSPYQNSCSDLFTPLKGDLNMKEATNITPALELMNLRTSFVTKNSGSDENPWKKPGPSSPSPLIEIPSSQDIFMDNSKIEESDNIKQGSESQNEELNEMDNQEIPLSIVITAPVSPSQDPNDMNESKMSDGEDVVNNFLSLPYMMETPKKNNNSQPFEDPESERKRKKLKKGGFAIRLQRLLNREQSWRRMWRHERLGKMNSSNDSSLLLLVVSIWPEATMILIKCNVESMQSSSMQLSLVVLLLDPVTVGERGIRAGCRIRLHPPWQTLMLNSSCFAVLLCANLLEVIPGGEFEAKIPQEKVVAKEYHCPCVENHLHQGCSFRFELGGQEFLRLLLPSIGNRSQEMELGAGSSEYQMLSTQAPLSSTDICNIRNEKRELGTISEVVADRSQRGSHAGASYLIARIQKIFCHRLTNPTSNVVKKTNRLESKDSVQWSALLQDSVGEFCEIEFASDFLGLNQEQADCSERNGPWWGSTNARDLLHEGVILRLNGVKILRRSDGNKVRGLPAVMNAVRTVVKGHIEEKRFDNLERVVNGQLFVYTFTSERDGSMDTFCDGDTLQNIQWFPPLVQTLFDSFYGWMENESMSRSYEGQRVTLIAKVLFGLQSAGDQVPFRLFVTDPSLSALNSRQKCIPWIPLIIKPACVIPSPLMQWLSQTSSLSIPNPVLCLQDVEIFSGDLIGDRYSRMFLVGKGNAEVPPWINVHLDIISFIRSSPLPRVPALHINSMPGELVSIAGNVVGIDEETAFSWPACNLCGNDHLAEAQIPGASNQRPVYHCNRCQSLVYRPLNKMSLDVFLACPALPPECCRVKVKLCQKSIMDLLPPNEEQLGYELTSVLGRLIGPLYCLLVSTHKNLQQGKVDGLTFSAEELKSFVNMQV